MSTLEKVAVSWNGFPGGPGVSIFYFRSASTARPALGTFLTAIKYLIPDNVTLSIPNVGDQIDVATGRIVGTWTDGTPITVVGSGSSGSYAAASGASVRWLTTGVINGHRVNGRTYFVPLSALAYDNGTLLGTAQTAFQSAASAFIADAGVEMEIVHRPTTKGGSDGASHIVTSAVVRDKQVVLTSRRD